MKKSLVLFCLLAGFVYSYSQVKNVNHCGSDDLHLKVLKENIKYKENFDANNESWQEWEHEHIKQNQINKINNTNKKSFLVNPPITLKIVFHDMYSVTNAPPLMNYTNLIDNLNEIYSGINPNSNSSCQEITLNAITHSGSSNTIVWSNFNLPNATIIQNDHTGFKAFNIEPGGYSIQLNAEYDDGTGTDQICTATKTFPFVIPYKAGIKYNATCAATAGNYTLTLFNHSVYYPSTPIQQCWFSTNGGLSWTPATFTNGEIQPFTTTLAGGASYSLGIKIKSSGYAECTSFTPLVLPNPPSALFHLAEGNSLCQFTAGHFIASDTTPGLKYRWTFSDGASNLQQNPVKSFATIGPKQISLTVTNQYGCSSTWGLPVNVIKVKLNGQIKTLPATACLGGTITLTYAPDPGEDMPTHFEWYQDNHTATPFATVNNNATVTVSQSGQYFVYVTGSNGCDYYENYAVTAAFIPAPAPPAITGTATVCLGNQVHLAVPASNTLQYAWSLNGVSNASWHQHELTDLPTATGSYVYSAIAQVADGHGGFCNSGAGSFVVQVIEAPQTPLIAISSDPDGIICTPYQVKLIVSNPQAGISYHWSNGAEGTQAIITHDGPIQLRAEAGECTASAQIDLPLDLESLTWIFPKGCFETCNDKPQAYIIGPLGNYANWNWLHNDAPIQTGNGNVHDFQDPIPDNYYQMALDNGYCTTTVANMNMQKLTCQRCRVKYNIEIVPVRIKDFCFYRVFLITLNDTGAPLWVSITVPNGQGYFADSNFLLPEGTGNFELFFNPLNNFTGGLVNTAFQGNSNGTNCIETLKIDFPPLCENAEELKSKFSNSKQFSNNLLLLAPNPASDFSAIYYGYANEHSSKTIEIVDMLGRVLQTWTLTDPKGTINFDCSSYANSTYIILMKENGILIEKSKLLISK